MDLREAGGGAETDEDGGGDLSAGEDVGGAEFNLGAGGGVVVDGD